MEYSNYLAVGYISIILIRLIKRRINPALVIVDPVQASPGRSPFLHFQFPLASFLSSFHVEFPIRNLIQSSLINN